MLLHYSSVLFCALLAEVIIGSPHDWQSSDLAALLGEDATVHSSSRVVAQVAYR